MNKPVLLYYGWLVNFGFGDYRPSDIDRISTEQHRVICSKPRDRPFTEMPGDESWVVPASLIVAFPGELEQLVNTSKVRIEDARSFQEAIIELRKLAYQLPCTQRPEHLELYHSSHLPPEIVLKEGLFSPQGYIDRFGKQPPRMVGQMAGDGTCTTLKPQEEAYNVFKGKKEPQARFGWGTSQYQISLDSPVLLIKSATALSIIDWYIKLKHDFGLRVYEPDYIQSHNIVAPTCNRIQGLSQFHKDMGYDVIETEYEHLIKKRHITSDKIKCIGSFS